MTRDGDVEPPLWKRDSEDFIGQLKFHNYTASHPYEEWSVETSGPELKFFAQYSRIQLFTKNLHIVAFVTWASLLIYAELSSLNGVSQLIPDQFVAHSNWSVLILILVCLSLITISFGWLFASQNKGFSAVLRTFLVPVLFYLMLSALVLGTTVSVLLVGFQGGGTLDTNIIHISGFFCLLYLGGPLTYDGMLRTQRLFNNIEALEIVKTRAEGTNTDSEGGRSDDDTEDEVTEWLTKRGMSAFGKTRVMVLMAILFVIPFPIIWYVESSGPFNTGSPWTIILVTFFDILIVTLAIHFVVLVRIMHSILTSSKGDPLQIVYKPFHHDSAAGFRDLGRFATRVNVLLLLGGLYLVYRLFVQGRLAVLTTSPTFELNSLTTLWMMNYLLPVVVYLIVGFVWFYYSFFIIHRAMKRGKEHRLSDIDTIDKSIQDSGNHWSKMFPQDYNRGYEIREYSDTRAYDEWQVIKSGPVWPINDRLLIALLSADLVSLGVALTALFA